MPVKKKDDHKHMTLHEIKAAVTSHDIVKLRELNQEAYKCEACRIIWQNTIATIGTIEVTEKPADTIYRMKSSSKLKISVGV